MENETILMHPIAHIRSDFPTKFGIPKQSGLSSALEARVVFCPEYRSADAVRGLEDFSYIWLLWQFSAAVRDGEKFSPTVRPPRLGGNERVGVFASRSPFRPNHIGISSVRLERVEFTSEGPVLIVRGADLMDGTPILDVKPYIPYADSHPDATGGFTDTRSARTLRVEIPENLLACIPEEKRESLREVLEQDPRPSYQDDPNRIYGFGFAGMEIRFRAGNGVLTVTDIQK